MNGKITTTTARQHLTLDTAGAFGFIEKIEVFDYLGSTVLESISGVPQLSALLLDLGLREVCNRNNGHATWGLAHDYSAMPFMNAPADGKTAITTGTSIQMQTVSTNLPPTSGTSILARQTAGPYSFSREFAIPLPSFLGLLSNKMVPLHNGFTIVLTLASTNTPFICNTPSSETSANIQVTAGNPVVTSFIGTAQTAPTNFSWQVSDVNMECQILELGPVAESMLLSSTQGQPFIVHTKAMRNYVGNVAGGAYAKASVGDTPVATNGQSEFTLNLNLNVASLTNILWMMRSTDQLDNILFSSIGNRTRNFLQRWQFQYGSTTLPQNNGIESMLASTPQFLGTLLPPDAFDVLSLGGTECYNELIKARPVYLPAGNIDDNFYWDMKFNKSLDWSATNPIIQLNMLGKYPSYNSLWGIGRFAAGLNLELTSNKEGAIISGLNTNGMNTSIRGFFHPLYLQNMDSVRVDCYAEYDAMINVSPGIATTVSF